MPADVQIHEMTAVDAGVDKTSAIVRFKSADETTVNTANRLQIPAADTNYSYTKQLRAYFNSAPSIDIQDIRAYSDGSNDFGTGIGVQYDVSGLFAPNIDTDIAGTDFFTKTSVASIDMDAVNTGPHTGTGYKGDFLRIQMTVHHDASPGSLAALAEPLTVAYDET